MPTPEVTTVAELRAELTRAREANAALARHAHELVTESRQHAQTAADFEMMLNQLLHATRSVIDSRVHAVRDRAMDLIRRKGTSSPLRDAAQAEG